MIIKNSYAAKSDIKFPKKRNRRLDLKVKFDSGRVNLWVH